MSWYYYNHTMLPDSPPHESPDISSISDGSIWKSNNAFLARWVTDFDCSYETNWWYIIKDKPFDISELKAKRRYEITKGLRNFDVRIINPNVYIEELYGVQVKAFSAYPKKYRPDIDKDKFLKSVEKWNNYKVYGAFYTLTGELCGYALLNQLSDICADFCVLKTNPDFERFGLNAAIVAMVLDDNKEFLSCGGYITDGSRSINHETNFQDYLEKYFNFRKAYCKLNIEFNPKLRWLIKFLYPLRKLFYRFDNFVLIHQLNAVMKMEAISRGVSNE